MTTRILLAVPPEVEGLEVYRIAGLRAPPLGLAWIAAVLEKAGYKVRILDSPTLNLSTNEFISIVKMWKPDVIGFTAITPTIYKAYRAAKLVKEVYPEVPIIMGGPHVTFMYDEALNTGNVDVVVKGEGEYTTLELIEVIEKYGLNFERLKEVRGIAFKSGDQKVIATKPRRPILDLDELPKPARHLLPMDKYTFLNKPVKVFHIMASRGCPYGCIYCSSSYFWGRRVRFRSVGKVVEEVEDAVYKYNIKNIAFTDDELTMVRKWILNFTSEVKSRGLDIIYTVGSRVDHADKEVLKALKESGCSLIYFGVESANQKTLDMIGKKITLDHVVKAFKNCKDVGLETVGSFILGFPWETIRDMEDTINFSLKLNPDYAQFTVLTPYPGTPIYYQALKENLIEDYNWEHYTTLKAVMRGYNFTRYQLQRMLRRAYRIFYTRLKFLWEQLRKRRLDIIFKVLVTYLKPY